MLLQTLSISVSDALLALVAHQKSESKSKRKVWEQKFGEHVEEAYDWKLERKWIWARNTAFR